MSRRTNATQGDHQALNMGSIGIGLHRRTPSPSETQSGNSARVLLHKASTTAPSRNVELCLALTLLLVPFLTLIYVYIDHSKHLEEHEQRSFVHAAVHGAEQGYLHEAGAAEISRSVAAESFHGQRNGESEADRERRIEVLQANVGDHPHRRLGGHKKRPTNKQCVETIKRAIKSTWDGYVLHALGYDEVKPMSKAGFNWWEGNYPVGGMMTAMVDEVVNTAASEVQIEAEKNSISSSLAPQRKKKIVEVSATKGLGMMVIDSLDTLWLAGMQSEFELGVLWVERHFCPECTSERVSFFEVTIRVLGGLLSAYELSGEPVLLSAAVKIGDMLLSAATEDSRRTVPRAFVRLNGPTWYDKLLRFAPFFELDNTNIVIIGSVQLEFYKLSEVTKNPKYEDFATRMMTIIFEHTNGKTEKRLNSEPGLPPVKYEYDGTVSSDFRLGNGEMGRSVAPLGAHGDSFYEYLLKVFIYRAPELSQSERDSNEEFQTWLESSSVMTRASKRVRPAPYGGDSSKLKTSIVNGEVVVSHQNTNSKEENINQDHDFVSEWFIINYPASSGLWQELTCFAGGLWALSSATVGIQRDLETATRYTKTCEDARIWMQSGLPPEQVQLDHFTSSFVSNGGKAAGGGGEPLSKWGYRLRPEMIESFFYLWLLTGEPMYQDQAWDFFLAVQEELFVSETGMYTTTTDVRFRPIPKNLLDDRMETFWMAETLKYLLMIFSFPAQPEALEHDKPWQSAYPGALQLPPSLCRLATSTAATSSADSADPVGACSAKHRVFTTEAHPMTVKAIDLQHHGATLAREHQREQRKKDQQ